MMHMGGGKTRKKVIMAMIQCPTSVLPIRARIVQRLLICIGATLAFASSHAIPGQPGTLDPTWGAASPLGPGKVSTAIGNRAAGSRALAIQADGKVVLGGGCVDFSSNFCVVRYNPDGTLDTTFNGTGIVTTPILGENGANAIVIQPNGQLVLAGTCVFPGDIPPPPAAFCAVRYNVDGTLDLSFGDGGKVFTQVGAVSSIESAHAVALQPDGKLVLAGMCVGSANIDFCTVRYNTDGTLDVSFAQGGKLITSVQNSDQAWAVAVQSDGKILVAGSCNNSSGLVSDTSRFCAIRYGADGSLDTSFGSSGIVITSVTGANGAINSFALALALQADGKIVLAGTCGGKFCAARYAVDGSLDLSFNGTGIVVTQSDTIVDYASAVKVQSDGKIVLAGNCSVGANNKFCANRYNSDGSLDATFSGDGKAVEEIASGDNSATALAIQPDGKIVIAGRCFGGTQSTFCSLRLDGGPFGARNCSLDMDGDNKTIATIDGLIATRVMLGITGASVADGISFPASATRTNWTSIREYLVTQCGMSLPL
jgi:uncharacterized delta-60 repeat protein